MVDALIVLFEQGLQKLEEEIYLFGDPQLLWKTAGEIKNSAGNLCLHLTGNLQFFIGAQLGNTGYVRNREAEFSLIHIPVEKLTLEIRKTNEVVSATLLSLKDHDLQKNFPQHFLNREVTTEYFLLHLLTHFHYHLGQVNYLRKMLV